MPFFHFNQNNSGGSFSLTDNLTHHVVVEAHDAAHANLRLTQLGGYFDGCSMGRDCDCCGDRWYPQWDDKDGDPEPTVYGKPVSAETVGTWMPAGKNAVVHYLDGTIKWF